MTQGNNTNFPYILAAAVANSLTPFGLHVELYYNWSGNLYPWDSLTKYGVFGRYVGEDRWHTFKEGPDDFFRRLEGKEWQILARKTPGNLNYLKGLAIPYGRDGMYITTSPDDNPNAVHLPPNDYVNFRKALNSFQKPVMGKECIGGVYVPSSLIKSGWSGPTIEETADLVGKLPPKNPLRRLLP